MEPSSAAKPNGHWSPYFVSSDAAETRELVGQNIVAHSLEHRSSQKRPATVRYRTASLGKLTLHDMAYAMFGEGEANILVPEMSHIYLCEINFSGVMEVGQKSADTPFRPGQIYMINANAPHAKRWSSDGRQMMIKIHQRDMEAAVERIIGLPMQEPLLFEPVPQSIDGPAATLANMIELLSTDLERDASFFAGGSGEHVERLILDLMLQSLPNNHSHLLSHPEPAIRPRHVRHAAEYVHAHSADAITLEALVTASGVSQRSLHAGFRKYYGVSPLTYVRNVRLDLARLRLKQQGAGDVSVTTVALDCGFTHLSKFSGAYKERFGELPSETLRST